MSGIVQFLLSLVLLALIGLVIYLILTVRRLQQLIGDVQVQMKEQVTPLLSETTQVMGNVNTVTSNAAEVSNTANKLVKLLDAGVSKAQQVQPASVGQKLGLRVAREVAIRVAGLSKAAATLKKEEAEKEADGQTETE